MKRMFKKAIIAASVAVLAGTGFASVSHAAGGNSDHKMEHQDWGFNGMFGTYDRAAMQRGFQVYQQVCAACHSLEHLSFRHLGDKGGPFYDPKNPNPNDNAVVKAIAAQWLFETPDIDTDTGDAITRPSIPADKFPRRFANETAARASNGGAYPVDLSIIVKARNGGADYLYDLLVSYEEAPHDVELGLGQYYNPAFDGGKIGMAPPLVDGLIEYASSKVIDSHGEEVEVAAPEATVEQMARDVTEFLAWSADPKLEVRKKTGFATLLYLLIFGFLTFATYKAVWRNVKH